MRPSALLVLVACAVVCLGALAAPAGAATINVPADYATIGAAIAAASPNDVILVAAGTYPETLTIPFSLTLQGAGPATTSIDVSGNPAAGNVITIGAITANVTISGFTIVTGPASTVASNGISISGMGAGSVVTITNNVIQGVQAAEGTAEDNFCLIAGYGSAGQLVFNSNVVYGGGSNPVLLERWTGPVDFTYNTIYRGPDEDTKDAIFVMNYGATNITTKQRFDHNTIDIGGGTIYDNAHRGTGLSVVAQFTGGTDPGGYTDVEITNNVVVNLKPYRRGLGLWDNSAGPGDITAIIFGNVISAAPGYTGDFGIRVLGGITGTYIGENAVSGVAAGVRMQGWNGYDPTGATIRGNNLEGSTAGIDNLTASTVNGLLNWWGTYEPFGVAAAVSGSVDYTPWLHSGIDASGSPGFQGDFSILHVDDDSPQTGTTGRIQEAIGLVTGSTVHVAAGVYHERLNVNRSLQLLGAQAGVDPTAGGARTDPAAESVVDLVGLGIANPNVLLEIPAGVTDVTVAGFTLNGSTVFHYADEATIRAWDDNIVVEDNIIDGYTGVLYKGNDHFALRRNRVTANKTGFTVQPSVATDVTVDGNLVVPGGAPAADAQGIYLTGVTGGALRGNGVSGFIGANAIGGSNLSNLVFEQNQLTGCKKGVNIWGTTTFIEIRQNTVTGHSAEGIVIKGQDLTISKNIVTGNDVAVRIDFHVLPTERVTILENDLSGSTTWALQVGASVVQAVNASGNWFGTATPAGVAAEVTGLADYTPWLAVGTDTSADPGFQGDFSALWVDDDSPQTGATGRIQEGINLVSGSTVHLAPGSYAENVVVNKKVVLQGSGDGTDPLVDTILLPAAGTTGITIQAGGTGPTDRCVIRDLRVSGGGNGIYTNSTLGYVTLQNLTVTGTTSYGVEVHNDAVVVDVAMTDVDLVSNVSTGMRVRGKLDGLAMTNGHIDGNVIGFYSVASAPPDGAAGNNLINVAITGTTFNDNSSKGMYFEKLSDAVFDGITVANSGTAGAWAAGIDINLKFADYQNIEIRNSAITGCGTGDLTNGVGVTIKARTDGGTYGPDPATLVNVDLTGNTITGCQNGIRFGEPGKNNPGPTVVDVHECLITGSVGVGLDNASLNVPTATCNWWGDALGPDVPPYNPTSGDGISGSATWAPFWTTATGPCDGFVPYVTPVTAGLCISTAHPCVTVPVTFTRGDANEVRGVSVTFQLGGGLTLCGTPGLSILQGTWLAGYSTQYGIVDNGGGSYTVDQAINGEPCGITTGGQLFTLALTSTSDGTGTVTITDVAVRDCYNAPLPGMPGTPGSIPIDLTAPPAPTALAAVQDKTANGPDGRTYIDVSWPAVEAGATVHVYRADYGNYPEYDDPPGAGSIPVPAVHPPGAPWVHAADVTSGTTLADEPSVRGFWYYVAYVEDVCGNVSPASNMTSGTLDYHLGDVMGSDVCLGDNVVGLGDVSLLGGHYGVAEGHALYLACLDVGPTTDRSVNARPLTDNKINFEDMMMFAINYGAVSLTTTPVAAVADDAVWVEGPAKVTAGQTFTASLRLSGSGTLLGLSANLAWNHAVAELVSVEAGELVTSQGGVALHGGGGLVDCALLGADRRLAGEGELARVTFRALASGAPQLAVGAVDARDGGNRTVELTGTPPAVAPAVTSLAPAVPNPFRGTTTLSYGLARAGAVELAIYGVDGRKVATLASGEQAAGSYRLVWDGGGQRPGLYYARLATPEGRFTRTIVLVK